MFSLEEGRLRGKLIECLKVLDDFTNVDESKPFEIDDDWRIISNGAKV